MRKLMLFLAAMVVIFVACSDDDKDSVGAEPIGIADLAGTWDLEVWEYTRASDSSQIVDWVTLFGLTGTLIIAQDGGFTVTPKLPWGVIDDFGTLTVDADSIYWDGEDDEEWVRFELSTRLTLFWPETEFLDMDQNGSREDVWLRVVYARP